MTVKLPLPYQELVQELKTLFAGIKFEDAKPIFKKLESFLPPILFFEEESENFTKLLKSSELEKARLEKELNQVMSTKLEMAVVQRAARNAGVQVNKIKTMLDELYAKLDGPRCQVSVKLLQGLLKIDRGKRQISMRRVMRWIRCFYF